MQETWNIIATQLPLAALFGLFAFILIKLFMDFIKEQRREFLEALEKLGEKIEGLESSIEHKRRL